MALALCLTLLPTAALAEETEGTAQTPPAVEESAAPANGEAKQEDPPAAPEQEDQPAEAKQENQPAAPEQENQQEDSTVKQDEAVAAVQAMIDALPDAAELDGMDDEALDAVYEAFQTACDAYYDALTEEQQAQLKNTEKLAALSDWFSQSAAPAVETHEHYLCGGTDCNGEGHGQEDTKTTFRPWTGTVATGAYYLTSDISGFTVPSGVDLTLCLNGYNITSDGVQNEDVITVEPGATFTLCDCKRGGTTGYGTIGHRRPDQYNGSGVTVENGTFNMYGGKIANNTVGYFTTNKSNGYGGGVLVFNKGIFNMIGGEITGNRARYGGGVSVGTAYGLHDNTAEDIGGTFNMTGGEISGNFCASHGGGVYACVSSKLYFTVSGSAQITDNYTGDLFSSSPAEGAANNVYLEKYTDNKTGETIMATIEVDGTLTGSIGVTTEEVGQTVATGVSEAAAKCFTSDDSKYRLIYDSGERTLTMATAGHSEHPVCGDVNCTNNDHALPEGKSWVGVSDLSKITAAGYYYLTADVEITNSWQPRSGVVLCLNGYDITMDGVGYAIYVREGYTFTLCDCFGGGKITHTKGVNGRGVYVVGTFNMYGGSISGNSAQWGSGVCLDNGGKGTVFNMYGGEITGNTATSSGGGGVNVNTKSTFNMYGGSITDNLNTASGDYGGGVYVSQDGIFTVSGKVNITGNEYKDNTVSNVYLYSGKAITVDGKLDSSASIGVTTKNAVDLGKSVTVATGAAGSCTEGNFFADKGGELGIKVEQGIDADSVNVNLYNGRPHEHPICGAEHEDIGDHTGACDAVNWTPWDGTSEIAYDSDTKTAYVYLTDNAARDSALTVADGYKLYLCLNGHSLTRTTSGPVIAVGNIRKTGSGATLSLCDCKGGGEITHRVSTSKETGAGVSLGHKSTFDMYGGSITDNRNGTGGGVSMGSNQQYGNNKFNMYGGSITNNVADNGYGDGGGGVHNLFGTFTMYGGSITENHADKARNGGGGVYLARTGTFKMYGGSITNNTAQKGGGVYVDSTGLTVSGDVTISGNTDKDKDGNANNVYLMNNITIQIGGALGENASIGVTTASTIANEDYLAIARGGSKYTLKEGDLNAFTSDNTAYGKLLLGNSVVFTNGDLHTHPICGKTCADEKHTDKIWQGVSRLDDITEAGYYYLTKDVMVIGKTWKPVNGVVLCLNGNSIVAAGSFDAISVDTGVTFTLTDCKPEGTAGQITHSFDGDGKRYISRGVDVSGTFNLYDGSIANNDTGKLGNPGGGVAVADSGTFHMYGGTITGNTALSGGGVDLSGGTFHMYGGEITGNTAYGTETNGGGGVRVGSGCTFTMSGGKISGNTTDGGGGGVYVYTRGTFNMRGDAVISGNKAPLGSGGGVCVSESGTFTMENGTIGGNTAYGRGGGGVYVYNGTFKMKNGTISGNSTDDGNGGGVYVRGIGGSFNMSGGTINGNTAKSSGGGVFVQGANSSFIMGGSAVISGNTAESNGGGVYMESANGAFTMNGGTISGNKATGLNGYGGGVYVASTDDEPSKFIMNSGTISGNTASVFGGGVYVYSTTVLGGTFTMNGGTISGNNGTYGGGVYVGKKANMTVSGGARIEDNWKNGTLNAESGAYEQGVNGSANNLYLYSVAIGTLAGTAHIGITTAKTPTAGDPVQFATGATNAALDYTTIFIPDAADQSYVVNKDESGNLFLNAHQHSWTYALKEGTKDTIIATCTADGCANRDGGSVMISASDAAYDGNAKAATVTAIGDWKGDAADSITVKYTGWDGTVYDSTAAPTDAGTYTASIKLGNATASVVYTIAKAAPTVDNFTFTAPSAADLTYNGNAKIAAVKAKDGVTGMGNITVKYFKDDEPVAEAKEVGNYTVKISVDDTGNNYHATTEDLTKGEWKFTIGKGTQTVNVPTGKTIVKNGKEVDISGWATVSGVEGGQATGALSYALVGSYPGVTLTEGKMLKVEKIVAKDTVITIKATAAATDDYNEAGEPFTVTVADKQPANLSVSMTGWTYGESANKPEYTAPEGVAATVTYAAQGTNDFSKTVPSDAGNYTVKVQYETDTKIYTGTAEFTISKREIAVPTADPTQFEYTGQEQTYVLSNFADASYYTVSNTMKRTDAGSQNVTVQLKDKNNTVWEDGTDEDKTYVFTIAPKPLSKVTIGDFLDQTYTGLSIRPAVAPVDGNTALTEDTDYTVSYGANTNVGKATITVTGTGNYTGTVCKEWNIIPAVLTISGATVVDKTYNGSADATVTAVAFNGLKNGEELVIGTDYEVHGAAFNDENVDAANKVTGTVALKNTEKTKNYTLSSAAFEQAAAIGRADYNGTASTTVNIVKGRSTAQTGTLTAADFFPEGQMPAGAAIVSVTPNSGTIIESIAVDGTNHKLDYVSKTNIAAAAEERCTVTIAATNYKDITATLTFHPTNKLVQDGFKFESGSVTRTYGDEDFTLTASGEVKGSTVTYESSEPAVATVDGTGKVTIKGAGTAVITAKAAATDEYDEAAATCTLTVEKKSIAIPAADATVFTYNGKPQTYALVENEAYTVSGNVQTDANETGYSVKAALKDTANTQWADGMTADKTYTFVIGKAVITVTAKDQTAYVGDKAPELGEDSYTVSGLVGEEKLTTQPTVKYVDADGNEIAPDMTKAGEVKILADGAVASGNYTIRYKDGKLTVSTHTHEWTYSGVDNTITAECGKDGCPAPNGGSVTINKPAHTTYGDGQEAAATVTSTLDSSITKPAITYKKGGAPLNAAPTDAGTYTASIKLGNATASVVYTIAKAAPTVDNFTFTAPSAADLTYNGNAKIAAVKAKDGVTGMGNITVKYFKDDEPVAEAKEVGNYTVKISVDDTGNNYHATTEDLSKGEWTFTIGKGTQTVNAPTGKTIVKNGKEVDISGWATVSGVEGGKTPGTLSYTLIGNPVGITLVNNKLKADPGTTESTFEIKATAAATNDYNEASQTFTVTVTDKKPANLSVSMTGWTYGESANKPGYTVPEGVAATVTYAAQGTNDFSKTVPTDAGNYTVKVQYETDTNVYTGTAEFTISKREIAVPTADPRQFEYTGQEQTYVLSNFADASYYTVSNTMKRTDAGSQNVTVQLKDKNNTVWEDGTDEDKTYVFTIAPKPLSKVTIGDFLDQTYTGLSIRPAVAPVDGNTALTEDTDYTVSYGANTNVGKATITVTGTGNYTGTVCKEWNIIPAVLTISGATVVDKTYNGSADATVTAVAFNGLKNGEELVIGTDYEVHGAAFNDENVDAANKVTGTVALKNTEKTKNYTLSSAAFEQAAAIGRADYNGTASTTVNIVKGRSTAQTGTLTAADFFPEGQMPAGAAIVSVTPNSGTIIESIAVDGTNHKLDYVSKTNIAAAAEERCTVTIAATNYKDITATLTFHPTNKLVQDGFKFESGSVTRTYGDEDFTLTASGEVKGSTVTYESSEPAVATVDGTGKVTIKGAGTAVITAKAAATDEYDEAAATCTLTVEKKSIAIPAADATVFTYNGKPQTYALVENEAYTVSGNVQTDANETGYSVKAALKDTANTQWADGMTADKTYTFVIGKAVITVTAKDQTAYVGDKAPELGEDSYTVSGLVGEEKLTTQPTVKYVDADGNEIAPDMTKAGEVKILADGAVASGNYTIRYKDGKLTVSTRPSSGGGGSSPSTNPVQTEVGKDPDGTVSLSKTSAAKGDKVTITVKPDRHYEVDEVIVRDSKGKQLAVKDNGDGTYTFEMPADKVTVEPTFTWVNPFADVANNAYYLDAVEWMLKREVTQGTTETTFSPNLNCTRAQIVTFLWRAAGSPEPKGTVSFADVPAGSYYAKAVAWAIENGITGGTGNGLFSPNAACTRAQSAAFLYRAAGSPAVNGSAGFSDVAADAYYASAVAWAKEHGITGGIGGGLFGSANNCTRAQIAAFLWRMYAKK